MRGTLFLFAVLFVWLENASPGAGLDLLNMGVWAGYRILMSIPAGLAIALVLLVPAFLMGADWRARAMLDEEQAKLDDKKTKWRVIK